MCSRYRYALVIFSPSKSEAVTLYRWPMQSQTTIQNYPDHNPNSPGYYNYSCQALGGYDGHQGTDTGRPYGTSILNGATGHLYYRYTMCPYDYPNNPDQTCGGRFGNHVRVQSPGDGRVATYAHMKYGSPANYMSALCSAKVGEVGSSGQSTYNHLHFELWADQYKSSTIDPFAGACNSGQPSRWKNQNGGAPTTQCQ
jgi:murein DD-endopeptidase MepM/ murein hydrolase activator NlpD